MSISLSTRLITEIAIKGAITTSISKISQLFKIGTSFYSVYKNKTKLSEHEFTHSLASIKNVKTLWQSSKSVSLLEFFSPVNVIVNKQVLLVNTLDDFKTKKIILLEGTVGQGKSILLRYLCLSEFTLNASIPLFIECRHLKYIDNLKEALEEKLLLYGFDAKDAKVSNMLFESGKIVVALDGFDEIKEENAEEFIERLAYFHEYYPNIKWIVSSRPNSGASSSNLVEVFKMQYIARENLDCILIKLTPETENINVKDLIQKLSDSPTNIQELVNTPLLASLLVFIYQSTNTIPEQFSEFYSDLFLVLLRKHDGTKPGFKRDLKTGVPDSRLQWIFSRFCFITKIKDTLSFKHTELIEMFELSLEKSGHDVSADALFYDISRGTNLIVEDGMFYSFIHKSIREYFTAEYLSTMPKIELAILSNKIVPKLLLWSQEMFFLKGLNEEIYLENFIIPSYDYFFTLIGVNVANDDIEKQLQGYLHETIQIEVIPKARHHILKFNVNKKGLFGNTFETMLTEGAIGAFSDLVKDNGIIEKHNQDIKKEKVILSMEALTKEFGKHEKFLEALATIMKTNFIDDYVVQKKRLSELSNTNSELLEML